MITKVQLENIFKDILLSKSLKFNCNIKSVKAYVLQGKLGLRILFVNSENKSNEAMLFVRVHPMAILAQSQFAKIVKTLNEKHKLNTGALCFQMQNEEDLLIVYVDASEINHKTIELIDIGEHL
jgi:hypothetical protein